MKSKRLKLSNYSTQDTDGTFEINGVPYALKPPLSNFSTLSESSVTIPYSTRNIENLSTTTSSSEEEQTKSHKSNSELHSLPTKSPYENVNDNDLNKLQSLGSNNKNEDEHALEDEKNIKNRLHIIVSGQNDEEDNFQQENNENLKSGYDDEDEDEVVDAELRNRHFDIRRSFAAQQTTSQKKTHIGSSADNDNDDTDFDVKMNTKSEMTRMNIQTKPVVSSSGYDEDSDSDGENDVRNQFDRFMKTNQTNQISSSNGYDDDESDNEENMKGRIRTSIMNTPSTQSTKQMTMKTIPTNQKPQYSGYDDDDDDDDPQSNDMNKWNSRSSSGSSDSSSSDDEDSQKGGETDIQDVLEKHEAEIRNEKWNAKFIQMMEMFPEDVIDQITWYRQIYAHFSRFHEAVSRIGKTIISEIYVPENEKTITPVNLGGIAGGDKFIVDNIFFKFSLDKNNLYGGQESAMKSAEHELKSIQAVYDEHIDDIHVPMTAMLDFQGFRLMASSVLPLHKNSFKLGSNNAGKTYHCSDKVLNAKVKSLAENLKLRGHCCKNVKEIIYGPIDAEGHQGTDGKYYLLDLARLFPPSSIPTHVVTVIIPTDSTLDLMCSKIPRKKNYVEDGIAHLRSFTSSTTSTSSTCTASYLTSDIICTNMDGFIILHNKRGEVNERASKFISKNLYGDCLVLSATKGIHLYRLLRKEFLKQHATRPLCSDGHSGFQDPDFAHIYNDEIFHATKKLFKTIIPNLANRINSKDIIIYHSKHLTTLMHQEGINIRYLGKLFHRITDISVRGLILNEMVSRICKRKLREIMRSVLTGSQSDNDYKKLTVQFFNLIFGDSAEATYFWSTEINLRLLLFFSFHFRDITEKKSKISKTESSSHIIPPTSPSTPSSPSSSLSSTSTSTSSSSDLHFSNLSSLNYHSRANDHSSELPHRLVDLRRHVMKLPLFEILQFKLGVKFCDEKRLKLQRDPTLFEQQNVFKVEEIVEISHLMKSVNFMPLRIDDLVRSSLEFDDENQLSLLTSETLDHYDLANINALRNSILLTENDDNYSNYDENNNNNLSTDIEISTNQKVEECNNNNNDDNYMSSSDDNNRKSGSDDDDVNRKDDMMTRTLRYYMKRFEITKEIYGESAEESCYAALMSAYVHLSPSSFFSEDYFPRSGNETRMIDIYADRRKSFQSPDVNLHSVKSKLLQLFRFHGFAPTSASLPPDTTTTSTKPSIHFLPKLNVDKVNEICASKVDRKLVALLLSKYISSRSSAIPQSPPSNAQTTPSNESSISSQSPIPPPLPPSSSSPSSPNPLITSPRSNSSMSGQQKQSRNVESQYKFGDNDISRRCEDALKLCDYAARYLQTHSECSADAAILYFLVKGIIYRHTNQLNKSYEHLSFSLHLLESIFGDPSRRGGYGHPLGLIICVRLAEVLHQIRRFDRTSRILDKFLRYLELFPILIHQLKMINIDVWVDMILQFMTTSYPKIQSPFIVIAFEEILNMPSGVKISTTFFDENIFSISFHQNYSSENISRNHHDDHHDHGDSTSNSIIVPNSQKLLQSKKGGKLWVWGVGKNNLFNVLQEDESDPRNHESLPSSTPIFTFDHRPKIYTPLSHLLVCDVAVSEYHLLFTTCDGRFWSMGKNEEFQLGHGDNVNRGAPTHIQHLSEHFGYSVASSMSSSFFITNRGTVYSCGDNQYNQLGRLTDTKSRSSIPHLVSFPQSVCITSIASSGTHTLFLSDEGNVYSCGSGGKGALGHGNFTSDLETAAMIRTISNIKIIKSADYISAAITQEGELYMWGSLHINNKYMFEQFTPKKISLSCDKQIRVEDIHLSPTYVAILCSEIDSKEGVIFEWGRIPQSGVSNSSPSYSPFELLGRDNSDLQFIKIDGSFCHRAILSSKRRIYTSGAKSWGQLGHSSSSTNAFSSSPSSSSSSSLLSPPRLPSSSSLTQELNQISAITVDTAPPITPTFLLRTMPMSDSGPPILPPISPTSSLKGSRNICLQEVEIKDDDGQFYDVISFASAFAITCAIVSPNPVCENVNNNNDDDISINI